MALKTCFTSLILIIVVNSPLFGDFPVRQAENWDLNCKVAYNSSDHEYLVIWQENIGSGSYYIMGPTMGQRVNEYGGMIGNDMVKPAIYEFFALVCIGGEGRFHDLYTETEISVRSAAHCVLFLRKVSDSILRWDKTV